MQKKEVMYQWSLEGLGASPLPLSEGKVWRERHQERNLKAFLRSRETQGPERKSKDLLGGFGLALGSGENDRDKGVS